MAVFSGASADLHSAEMNENVGSVRNRASPGREWRFARRGRKLDRDGSAEATPVSGNISTRIDSGCEQHGRKRFRGEIRRLDRFTTEIPVPRARQGDENACGLFETCKSWLRRFFAVLSKSRAWESVFSELTVRFSVEDRLGLGRALYVGFRHGGADRQFSAYKF